MKSCTSWRGRRPLAQSGGAAIVVALVALIVIGGAPTAAQSEADTAPTVEIVMEAQNGHHVGGVALDLIGNIYVADFSDTVWRITPEGEASVFATGFYGASGNTVDNQGRLIQANFYGNSISRVSRAGAIVDWITDGLSGPVGVALHRLTGELFVANCRSNTISRVDAGGEVTTFAEGDLFNCPNGVTLDGNGNLYVVNFSDNRMIKITPEGEATLFAAVSDNGLGHVYFKTDRLFVTAFMSHQIYEVSLEGEVRLIAGSGERGVSNGEAASAQLSYPNGLAINLDGTRLYFNEFLQDQVTDLPRVAQVRRLNLR